MENEGYIKKLLNLFRMCEDIENSQGLHHLYEIFKNIFLLNKNALFEVMFAGEFKNCMQGSILGVQILVSFTKI